VISLKDLELKLIAELMKNSRRSDRQLAKAIGISQPTVSRMIKNLEKQGVIKEYTVIPDFTRLGLNLLTVTLVKHRRDLDREDATRAERKVIENVETGISPQVVMVERGLGFGYDSVIISYEKDYSDFTRLLDRIRSYEHVQTSETQSFIIDLNDKVHYRSFTYSTLAKYLLTMMKQEKE
jgi:DNA-binding Lrp family transcriptional regulator